MPKVSEPADLFDRQPPCDLEAERNILGSILIQPLCCDDVSLILRPDDFYESSNRILYDQLLDMHGNGKRIDSTLVVSQLKKAKKFDEIGGAGFLAEVISSVPTAANAEHYAHIVRDKSMLRSLIIANTESVKAAYDQCDGAVELVSRCEESVFAIRDGGGRAETTTDMREALMLAFEQIDASRDGKVTRGVSTGLVDLDRLTGGLHKSELTIIAARPSMGKSALALNIAEHAAIAEKTSVLLVSLEMSKTELTMRMLCSRARIRGERLRSGFLTTADHDKLVEVSGDLGSAPILIDDTPSRRVSDVAALARRQKRRPEGLGLVIVDYLQLLSPDDSRISREQQVASMARRLKCMARELDLPVIVISQLNRQAEYSKDNRPKLSHLRESGAIEQDADVVLLVHREEYYLSPEERQAMEDGTNTRDIRGEADLIIAKQRSGPTGSVKLHWFQQFTKFENADRY